ncbi:PadR family transcriptional regulator [Paenibacillus athensensis]|uniref:Transcription regulator PadR N-terminal domain-containing protein n=1 Tax=Paenibacillus athensensis TaxID=1967502 RepID=A0A4Y8PUU4_9BACL|nr:PadR family transcriptional regulator [Paenibacillus athensensis]MCD1260568.1 PadR family transcriptional regulator [Paenibacillus athensensis]
MADLNSQDVILGILMKGRYSGYEIKQLFEDVYAHFYNASFGTIYPTLTRMEKMGLITKQSVIQEGKPNKNVFTITEAGKQAFLAYMDSEVQENEWKSDFMVRLFLGEFAEPERVASWMEMSIAMMEEKLAKLLAERCSYEGVMSPTQAICLKLGIEKFEGQLRVLRAELEAFRQLSATKES